MADWQTVKIRKETHGQLGALTNLIAQNGWKAAGSERSEAPTQELVINEAITQLLARMQAQAKKRGKTS